MSHTTVWRNRDRDLDLTPGLLHEEALGGRAARCERAAAVVDAATGASLAYGELADRAPRPSPPACAPGARAAATSSRSWPPTGPTSPMAMHGALGAGLTLAPASPLLTARELGAFLRQVGARFVVADAGRAADGAAAARRRRRRGAARRSGRCRGRRALRRAKPWTRSAIALLMSSSGTTGPAQERRPHARGRSRDRCAASPPSRSRAWGRTTSSAGVIPMAHIFGSVMLNCDAARRGADRDAAALRARGLPGHGAGAPRDGRRRRPPLARALARHPLVDRYDLSSLRLVRHRRRAVPDRDRARVPASASAASVGQSFGMTELAPIALPEEEWRPGSLGRLVPGVEAVVVDATAARGWERGRRASSGSAGRRSWPATSATRPPPKATIDAQGWLHSGDLALFDEDGQLFVVDRLKELIKCRGYQVAPAQLEAELALHPAVADAAVVGASRRGGRRAAGGLRRPARPGAAGGDPRVAGRPRGVRTSGPSRSSWSTRSRAIPTGKLLRRVLVERERERAAGARPSSGAAPERLLLPPVERLDERVVAGEEPVGVRVPEPHVERHEVRVPEGEGGAGVRGRLRAAILRRLGHEGPVGVVAGRRERAVAGARERRLGRLLGEDPLERGELPRRRARLLVDEDRRAADVEVL